MYPTPFIDFIPKIFKDNADVKTIAFCYMVDKYLSYMQSDILGLRDLFIPEKCPSWLLNDLGYFLNAGILQNDTDREKRKKIYKAIAWHKNKNTWLNHCKQLIDQIVGHDSKLFPILDLPDWIGMGSPDDDTGNYWASLGTDNIDDLLGIDLIGIGNETALGFIVLIDVDSSTLSAADVQKLVDNLSYDVIPAYFRAFLGYVSGGNFVYYSGGQIH